MYRFTQNQVTILENWSPTQRFWLQSWLELLHEFSASVFRVRPIPISSVAAEIVELIELWKAGDVTAAAVEDVRLELLNLVSEDPLLATVWPEEQKALLWVLGQALESHADLAHLVWRTSRLSQDQFADSYRAVLIDQLEEAISSGQSSQHKRIRALSERLIAELLWSGYSETWLFRGAMRNVREDSDPESTISTTLRRLSGTTRDYECIFQLDRLHHDLPNHLEYAGVEFRKKPWPPVQAKQRRRRRFARIKLSALDPYSAADEASISLRRASDALVFAAPLQAPQIRDTVYVQHHDSSWTVDILDTATFGLLPSGVDRIPRYQSLFGALTDRSKQLPALDAIHIALHWYSAAVSSAALDLERTFLSLWIGLEYLVSGHGRPDYAEPTGIVVPIKHYLARLAALYLPSLLIRDFTNYLYRLVENNDVLGVGALEEKLPGPHTFVDEVTILSYLNDDAWVEELSRQRDSDELLIHRIDSLRQRFESPDNVLRLMRTYVDRSERDIAHIYRVRNNIAHGGAFGHKLPLLRYGIRIAHDQLRQLVESLLYFVSRDKSLDVSDVLMSAEMTYSALQNARTDDLEVEDLIGPRSLFVDV